MTTRTPTLGAALLLSLALSGCGKDATFTVRPSVEQLHVTHAVPQQALEVVDARGAVVAQGAADAQGSYVFRRLAPGTGYLVRTQEKEPAQSKPLTVMSVASSAPATDFYSKQALVAGFNYITVRDGTTLSAWVTLPRGRGPFPTVVNYSGYDASRPQQPNPDFEFLCADFPSLCTPPTDPSALLASLLGYATVSVNIRGTGCSGGAYDYFETLQVLDGYDVIETVAAQPWALHHQVGMVGLSYPGISQFFVAAQRPPGLAAIAPMSVIAGTETTLLPGGMLNDGFALAWVDAVLSKAVPYGQKWEQARVDGGDTVCAENQLLHSQYIDNVAQARQLTYYVPEEHDRFSPITFADKIQVPVFLTGSWQDEQTGPYFHLLFDKLSGAPARRLTAVNGVHIDGFGPDILGEWHAFLELFVARRLPQDPAKVRNISPLFYTSIFDASLALPAARFSGHATYEEALAAWKAESPVRILFESGAGGSEPGAPRAAFERGFSQWPPAETSPLTLFFQPGAKLAAAPPQEAASASSFRLVPGAGATGNLAPRGDIWAKTPNYAWAVPAEGEVVVVESEPFTQDAVLAGSASVDLFLRSPVEDADLEVTLSEVRADGKEVYLQSGWLRASQRKPGPSATALWPAQTHTQADAALLVPGVWTEVRVGTAGFAHVVRAGSRVRVEVDTPGGARAEWRFALKPFPSLVTYDVGHDATRPSKVVLPVLAGVVPNSQVPPCVGLRGQPCRDWTAPVNVAATP